MKALFEKIPLTRETSFNIREFKLPRFDMPLHFHPELELTWIISGKGSRIVGDNIVNYQKGDLVLIGPNLPHCWYSDKEYAKEKSSHSVVIHFNEDFLGSEFFAIPEMSSIRKLLQNSIRGISIDPGIRGEITRQMQKLLTLEGSGKIVELLAILDRLAQQKHLELLSSQGFGQNINSEDCERINKVCQYLLESFTTEVKLEKAASIINMNPPAFCFYFKKRTGKRFSQFVNEIRLGHACKLMMETDKTISEICYASGFNNLSNFNRRFKELHEISPSFYRRKMAKFEM